MNITANPWSRTWKLRTTTKTIESLMISDTGDNNEFTLSEVIVEGQLVCYRVGFATGKMAPCWNGRLLFPRGNKPVDVQLNGIDEKDKSALLNAALVVQGAVNSHRFETERLECDITLPGPPPLLGALSLYQVPAALTGGNRMLVVGFRCDGNPGGTGGGGSDHP
jgi:hypothetical protein